MDLMTLVFYAVICGALTAFGPRRGGAGTRFALGAAVGIFAAAAFPYVRAAIGV